MMKKTNCSRIVALNHTHKAFIEGIRSEIDSAQPTVYELLTLRYASPKIGREVATDFLLCTLFH